MDEQQLRERLAAAIYRAKGMDRLDAEFTSWLTVKHREGIKQDAMDQAREEADAVLPIVREALEAAERERDEYVEHLNGWRERAEAAARRAETAEREWDQIKAGIIAAGQSFAKERDDAIAIVTERAEAAERRAEEAEARLAIIHTDPEGANALVQRFRKQRDEAHAQNQVLRAALERLAETSRNGPVPEYLRAYQAAQDLLATTPAQARAERSALLERLLETARDRDGLYDDEFGQYCYFCAGVSWPSDRGPLKHEADCPYKALTELDGKE